MYILDNDTKSKLDLVDYIDKTVSTLLSGGGDFLY